MDSGGRHVLRRLRRPATALGAEATVDAQGHRQLATTATTATFVMNVKTGILDTFRSASVDVGENSPQQPDHPTFIVEIGLASQSQLTRFGIEHPESFVIRFVVATGQQFDEPVFRPASIGLGMFDPERVMRLYSMRLDELAWHCQGERRFASGKKLFDWCHGFPFPFLC